MINQCMMYLIFYVGLPKFFMLNISVHYIDMRYTPVEEIKLVYSCFRNSLLFSTVVLQRERRPC